jgi:signal peptidase I
MKSFLRDILITLILAAVIFLGLQATLGSVIVEGPSMLPNFQNGQRLLVNKAVYKFFHPPERGDVIILQLPTNSDEDYIKRVIGLSGELVEIEEGTVYIHKEDGSVLPLDES